MIGSVIQSWEEIDNVLDARNGLKYLEDISKMLLIQTSRVLRPLHSCILELEGEKNPTFQRLLVYFCENRQDLFPITKIKAVGRINPLNQ